MITIYDLGKYFSLAVEYFTLIARHVTEIREFLAAENTDTFFIFHHHFYNPRTDNSSLPPVHWQSVPALFHSGWIDGSSKFRIPPDYIDDNNEEADYCPPNNYQAGDTNAHPC